MSAFIVGYETSPGEWRFAGIYEADTADGERQAAENAVRQAAAQVVDSDVFGAIPVEKMQTVRVAYRRNVVGIAKDDPAP